MSGNQEFSVPRRTLDVEDYVDLARRQKGWIFGPAFLVVVAATVAAFLWPDTYVSEAAIQVVPPAVSQTLVPSVLASQLSDRVETMANRVLSRNQLLNLVQTHNLYPKERQRLSAEDIVERDFRPSISVGRLNSVQMEGGTSPITAFTVSFRYTDRVKARDVTQALATAFIDENIRDRENRVRVTDTFLSYELDKAQKELQDIEQKLADYRARNAGRLPENLTANTQQVRAYEAQLTGINTQVSQINQRKLLLEGEVRIGTLLVKAGAYHLAPRGVPHEPISAEFGALLFLRGAIPAVNQVRWGRAAMRALTGR
ncbi:MAG: hypothetical protein ABI831_28685 [Betaproteobacteria bacterium]